MSGRPQPCALRPTGIRCSASISTRTRWRPSRPAGHPWPSPGPVALLAAGRAAGRIRGAARLEPWIDVADLVLVCVGTPEGAEGRLDLGQLLEVTRQLGRVLARRAPGRAPLGLVYRSTVPPGTHGGAGPADPDAGLGAGPGAAYEVAYHPEFLREGSAIEDYRSPGRGSSSASGCAGAHKAALRHLRRPRGPLVRGPFRTAEAIKLVDNGFHALKVAFANEVGRLGTSHGVDPQPWPISSWPTPSSTSPAPICGRVDLMVAPACPRIPPPCSRSPATRAWSCRSWTPSGPTTRTISTG